MNIDPKNTTAIKCEKCENETFREVVFLRKASRLLTGQPNDAVVPIPTFQCSSCGHINKEFTPKFDIA
jgi:uncharacterized Zn finger protein